MKKYISLFFIIGSLQVNSQVTSPRSVMSNGASEMSGNGLMMKGTIGQSIISNINSGNLIALQGYWPIARRVIVLKSDNQSSEKINVSIFPNPTVDQINIDLTTLRSGNYKIEIIDLLGNVITTSSSVIDNTIFKIGVEELVSGCYFIVVRTSETSLISIPFVKL
ncbi:MAG: T9SS type A sorting domain-containing protein [Saprospiraceae bacterium]|nr:T9SS type A sorting domain-containing protein [Saprospiraceae bacterium]